MPISDGEDDDCVKVTRQEGQLIVIRTATSHHMLPCHVERICQPTPSESPSPAPSEAAVDLPLRLASVLLKSTTPA